MNNFTIKAHSIRQQIAGGYVNIGFQPKGYWSDVISLTFARDYRYSSENSSWKMDIGNSSGGRGKHEELNPEQDISDMEATGYFIEAYEVARTLAQRLIDNAHKYEAYAQFKHRKNQERIEAKLAAKQAKIDADTAIGEKMATAIVDKMKADIKEAMLANDGFANDLKMVFKKRGVDETFTVKLYQPNYSNVTRFAVKESGAWAEYGSKSRKEVIKYIANSSITHYVS